MILSFSFMIGAFNVAEVCYLAGMRFARDDALFMLYYAGGTLPILFIGGRAYCLSILGVFAPDYAI